LFLFTKCCFFYFINLNKHMGNNVKPYIQKTIMYENNTRITFEKLTILRFQTSQCPQFCQSPIFNNFFGFDYQYKKVEWFLHRVGNPLNHFLAINQIKNKKIINTPVEVLYIFRVRAPSSEYLISIVLFQSHRVGGFLDHE
jgi:hypothetical protein